MKYQCYYLLVALLLLSGCANKNKFISGNTKQLNYGYFTIQVPKEWKRVNVKGIDSYVGEIQIEKNTTIFFDLGWYSNELNEGSEDYIIRHDSLMVKRELPFQRHSENYTYDYHGKPDSASIAALTLNRKQWITIDGYNAKLITPIKEGKGTTGLYIDSLWTTEKSNDKFQINGQNLNKKQQEQLIAAFKTLKFFQNPKKLKE